MARLIEVGECPVHGLTPAVQVTDVTRPEINTGPLCQTCYIEWIKENGVKLANPRLVQVDR